MKEHGDALVLLLAGGIGSRLNLLVGHRAKPAVPFGGLYRIIDFSLSNVMNSGLRRVGVLTSTSRSRSWPTSRAARPGTSPGVPAA